MAHKNDYTVIAYFESGTPKKWTYVHTLFSIARHLDEKHPGWKYFNVYERRTGKYLKRFYKGNFIPAFLSLVLLLLAAPFQPLNSTFNNSGEAKEPDLLTFNISCEAQARPSLTFNNGFNNTATIWTLSGQKGGFQ